MRIVHTNVRTHALTATRDETNYQRHLVKRQEACKSARYVDRVYQAPRGLVSVSVVCLAIPCKVFKAYRLEQMNTWLCKANTSVDDKLGVATWLAQIQAASPRCRAQARKPNPFHSHPLKWLSHSSTKHVDTKPCLPTDGRRHPVHHKRQVPNNQVEHSQRHTVSTCAETLINHILIDWINLREDHRVSHIIHPWNLKCDNRISRKTRPRLPSPEIGFSCKPF